MTENLPAVRNDAPVATTDTDSWIQIMSPLVKLADTVATTEFVPKNLRGKPAAVTAALLYGREVGLPPMTTLTMTHVVEGKPAMSAEGMRALVLAAGHDLEVLEASGGLVRMRGRRRGSENWTTLEWSMDMARAAGLAGKQVWQSYPRAMLTARCTAELARLIFPDVIHGFRAMEEFDEVETPEEEAPAAPTTAVRRRTAKKALPAAAPQPAGGSRQRPSSPGVPLPGEEGFEQLGSARPSQDATTGTSQPEVAPENGDSGEAGVPPSGPSESSPDPAGEVARPGADDKRGIEGEAVSAPDEPRRDADAQQARPSPAADDGPVDAVVVEDVKVEESAPSERPAGSITRAQLNMLHASFGGLGLKGEPYREERLSVCSRILRKEVESTADLSKDDASTLIDTLARVQSVADLHALLDAHDEG